MCLLPHERSSFYINITIAKDFFQELILQKMKEVEYHGETKDY